MGEPEIEETPSQETPSGTTEPMVLRGLEGLEERAGQEIGTSSWRTVEQDGIDTSAKLTGDAPTRRL
jgi:hypothetical protein